MNTLNYYSLTLFDLISLREVKAKEYEKLLKGNTPFLRGSIKNLLNDIKNINHIINSFFESPVIGSYNTSLNPF